MKAKFGIVALVCALLLASVGGLSAQGSPVNTRVLQAAVEHVLHSNSSYSAIAVSRDVLGSAHGAALGKAHQRDFLEQLSRGGRARVVSLADTYVCASRLPSSCRLNGTDFLVTFAVPVISGNGATVDAEYRLASSHPRQPVESRTVRLVVELKNGKWVVASEVLLRQS